MPSTKSIQQRIRSVRNTAQITKAMEAVSANKMRKSQEFAIRARPYAVASLEMLKNILERSASRPPLLQSRPIRNSLLLVVTSDKGLAGAFNANVLRKAEAWIETKQQIRAPWGVVSVGKKAKDYLSPRAIPIYQSFVGFGDYSRLQDTLPVAELVLNGFQTHQWDAVEAVHTHFRTTLRQETVVRQILPATEEALNEIVEGILPEQGRYADLKDREAKTSPPYQYEYKFEPSPEEILNALVPQLLYLYVHHVILESNASEHSARMVAMKSASDNAKELINDLTLLFNKARQAGITRELTEITAGTEALGS